MKFHTIPGVLAIGLAAILPAAAEKQAAAEKKPAAAPEAAPAAPEAPKAPADPAAVKKDSSYALGLRTGAEFGQRYGAFGVTPADLDSEAFLKGFLNSFNGKKPEIDEAKLAAAMEALGNMLQTREKELATKNLEEGKKFLAENAKKEGVTTTKSGLQYSVIEKGGDKKYVAPKEGEAEKQFMVNYKGTLINGTEFDASPDGKPIPMTMQVIEGFKEALTLMPVGAKWKLFIPSELAYGEQRRSADIAPNTALIFELELVEIKDAPPAHSNAIQFPGAPGGEDGGAPDQDGDGDGK
ncbi:MAG: Peptidyl-prolyl cis-trans isomerase [Akkermansiaceae bacterium]|nr:Peptidyl-prolyl cis-trans isomerase [Akkermansiaceae bacterium]